MTAKVHLHRALFRASAAPTTALPLGLRSVGAHCIDPAWQEPVKTAEYVQLFWGIAGEGEFQLRGRAVRLGPQEVFYYLPGDRYELRATAPRWTFRWLTLDGPLNAQTLAAFALPQAAHRAGPCPEALFDRLEHSICDPTPGGQRTAAAAAYELLSLACGGTPPADSLVQAATEAVHRFFSDPAFNVNRLARDLGVNRSQLSRAFRARTGVSLIDFITARRVQHALSLLMETTLPVEEIARRSGYSDPGYFARVLHKRVGVPPTRFRRQ